MTMNKHTKVALVVTAVLFLATIACGFVWYLRGYLYDVRVGQYVLLADDASLPAAKWMYLHLYRDAVVKYVHREDARYLLKQTRLSKSAQLGILDSLIERLNALASMPPDSMAYQTGMQQITGQEFDHVIYSMDAIFYGIYVRDNFWGRFLLPYLWLMLAVLCIVSPIVFVTCEERNRYR